VHEFESAGDLLGREGALQLAAHPAAQGRVEPSAQLAGLRSRRRPALGGHGLRAGRAVRTTQRGVAGELAADRAGAASRLRRDGTPAQTLLGKKADLRALFQAQARISSGHGCKSLKLLDVLHFNFESAVQEEVLASEGFAAYLAWLQRGERGELEGFAPWSAFWAIEPQSSKLVGISSLRHSLGPWMAEFGGHIGYRVHPQYRRRGYGTEVLRQTLTEAAKRNINPALVLCAPEHLGSQGVLRNAGAVFERKTVDEGLVRLRYWVPTSAPIGAG
jgi:predicted acetyltransferase